MTDDRTTLERLTRACDEAHLPLPPIPARLVPQLRKVEEWVYSSRPLEWSPGDALFYLHEALRRRPPDYVLIAHAGVGLNGWALHYFLLYGPIAVFLQMPWGGARLESDVAVSQIGARFAAVARLISSAPRVPAGERLVVSENLRHGVRWARGPSGGSYRDFDWYEADDPVSEALASLGREER